MRSQVHPDTPADQVRQNRRAALMTVALAVVALATSVLLWQDREHRALMGLEPAARRVLFEKTMASFGELCARRGDTELADAVAGHCADDAQLLRRFPECDEACQVATGPFVPHATR